MSNDALFFDLIDACAEAGCPLCRLSSKFIQRYLESVIYEYVNDPGVRDRLRAARGYCHEHAWGLTRVRGSSLGVAIIYNDILEAVMGALGAVTEGRGARPRVEATLKGLRPGADCPACAQRDMMANHALDALLSNIDDQRLYEALAKSSGLCLPHLRRALERAKDSAAARRLAVLEQDILAELQDELAEFIRKSDYRFHDEGMGAEGDSWLRAIAIVAGQR